MVYIGSGSLVKSIKKDNSSGAFFGRFYVIIKR